ncbi:MAG: hypothetical protein WCT53_05785 [Candidatus Gracilibacteria bacterium]
MYRRVPLSIEVPKVMKLLVCTLMGLLVMTSVYFFIKTSNTAERGYSMRENQLRRDTLENENRILKQRLLEIQAVDQLQLSDAVKGMEEAINPIYIKPKGPLSKRN